MAKATALLSERDYVVPEDIVGNIECVCTHRIVPSSKAKASGINEEKIIKSIKNKIDMPLGNRKKG